MKKTILFSCFALVLIVLAQGFYASQLNRLFYEKYGPFFDSMGYTNQMAQILSIAKVDGIGTALSASMQAGTVTLPWLTVSLLSPVIGHSRLTGVWMQEFWMGILALSIFFYLHRYRGASAIWSVLLTIPFLSFEVIYRHNAGVSDFRMDLFLYMFLSLMAVWYLATMETTSPLPWILSGLFLLLTILNRATAPMYMLAMFGPPLVGRFLMRPGERLTLLRRVGLYWGVASVLGALALRQNWAYIYDYYFVVGADPTANLPLRQSIYHLYCAWKSVGQHLSAALVLMALLQLSMKVEIRKPLGLLPEIDWQALYIGFAPALMLALNGAGLNPFVSMPTVFGWTLFSIAPLRGTLRLNMRTGLGTAALLAASLFCAWRGYAFHTQPGDNKIEMMGAIQQGLGMMEQDARARGKKEIQFITSHLGDFQASALRNVLVYDLGASVHNGNYRMPSGLVMRGDYESPFSPPVLLNWDRDTPGRTDEEKTAHLAEVAKKQIDYCFLPDDESIRWLEKNRGFYFINTKIGMIKAKLLGSGLWHPVGGPLVVSEGETVILYGRR